MYFIVDCEKNSEGCWVDVQVDGPFASLAEAVTRRFVLRKIYERSFSITNENGCETEECYHADEIVAGKNPYAADELSAEYLDSEE